MFENRLYKQWSLSLDAFGMKSCHKHCTSARCAKNNGQALRWKDLLAIGWSILGLAATHEDSVSCSTSPLSLQRCFVVSNSGWGWRTVRWHADKSARMKTRRSRQDRLCWFGRALLPTPQVVRCHPCSCFEAEPVRPSVRQAQLRFRGYEDGLKAQQWAQI